MAQAAFNKAGWLVVGCSDASTTQPLSGWAGHDGRRGRPRHDDTPARTRSRTASSYYASSLAENKETPAVAVAVGAVGKLAVSMAMSIESINKNLRISRRQSELSS